MNINTIKYDCKYFKGSLPCTLNKKYNSECCNCEHYCRVEKKILIIKLAAIGDVIRTTPLIRKYKDLYPNSEISWLTQFPDVLPKNEIKKIYKLDAVSLFTLSNKKFDIAINLDKEEEVCILLKKIDAKEKYGFIWENEHIFPATPAAEHKLITGFFDGRSKINTKHYVEEIFEICHLEFNDEPYLLNVNENLCKKWVEILKNKANGKIIVGLNTGCGNRWSTRLWDDKNWQKLIELLQNSGFFPVVLGGEQENEKNLFFAKATKCYYPGTYSLEEFFAITSACNIIVTQVSMMMHIAVALQKKMVLMNNIFNKHEFYLYNRGVIVEPSEKCECYYGNTCKKGESCMKYILPERVFEKIALL